MKKLLLATALALGVATQAMAGTINLQLQEDAGPTQTFLGAPGQSTFTSAGNVFGDFLISNITGSTTPTTIVPVLLSTNTLDVQQLGVGTPHTLQVWITANGLTSPLNLVNMFSGLTNVTLSNGWSVNLQTELSVSNAMFAGALVAQDTFTGGPNPTTFSSNFTNLEDFGNGPFSLTAHYTILTDGLGQANSGISVQATAETPLPAAIWMFGSALGGAALMMRRKRKVKTAWSMARA